MSSSFMYFKVEKEYASAPEAFADFKRLISDKLITFKGSATNSEVLDFLVTTNCLAKGEMQFSFDLFLMLKDVVTRLTGVELSVERQEGEYIFFSDKEYLEKLATILPLEHYREWSGGSAMSLYTEEDLWDSLVELVQPVKFTAYVPLRNFAVRENLELAGQVSVEDAEWLVNKGVDFIFKGYPCALKARQLYIIGLESRFDELEQIAAKVGAKLSPDGRYRLSNT